MGTRGVAVTVIVILVVVFGGWVAIAQLTDSGNANEQTDKSVNVVLNGLDRVRGKKIAVDGYVKVTVKPWGVILGSSDASQTGLLVIAKTRVPDNVRITSHVTASGVAQAFSVGAFKKAHPEVSARELARTPLSSLAGHPAIVSASIVQSPAR